MSSSPASILFDIFGTQITTVSGVDGVRLGVSTKGTVGIDSTNTGGLALEATASGIAQILSSTDFATETKLEAIRLLLSSLDEKDYATQVTLSGAATSLTSLVGKDFATQTTLASVLSELQQKTEPSDTQLVSVASLPLPAGAATEATASGIAQTVSSINSKNFATESTLTSLRSDFNAEDFATQATLSGLSVTLTAIKNTDGIKKIVDQLPAGTNNIGDVDVVSSALPTGASTSALQGVGNNNLASIDQKFPLLGQGTLASGIPVSIASNQTAIPVTDNSGSLTVDATSWPLPTGAATEVTASGINITLKDIRDTVGIKKITDGVQLQASSNNIGSVKIADGQNGVRLAYVDTSNRLIVSANATVVPAASTEVLRTAQSDLTGTSDDVYTITNGKVLTVSRFAGGAEGNSGKRTKCELYYDPAGTGIGMTLLRAMYLGGTNYEFSLDDEFTGDGTRAIRMRRERLDGAADEVFAAWNGFET
jgi:hypothetical protein